MFDRKKINCLEWKSESLNTALNKYNKMHNSAVSCDNLIELFPMHARTGSWFFKDIASNKIFELPFPNHSTPLDVPDLIDITCNLRGLSFD